MEENNDQAVKEAVKLALLVASEKAETITKVMPTGPDDFDFARTSVSKQSILNLEEEVLKRLNIKIMKTPICQWLNDLSEVAGQKNVIIEAKYFDGLEFFFKSGETPESALPLYNDLVRRINAIESDLKPLTEMSGDHFSQIFTVGFAPSYIKERVSHFNSLFGFHRCIADLGHFESHRKAITLGYDVEFTLDRP